MGLPSSHTRQSIVPLSSHEVQQRSGSKRQRRFLPEFINVAIPLASRVDIGTYVWYYGDISLGAVITMKQYSMNLRLFQQKFQTESACQQHLFSIRWPDGFCCPKCGHREYYKISKPLMFQCKSCRHQTSLTAGTILHKTRTQLTVWFWALFLVAHDNRRASAPALSRELDVVNKTDSLQLDKIRRVQART